MKNLLYGTLFLALVGISFNANAKEIVIDEKVVDSDGCVWTIKGTIDVSTRFTWPPIQINSYNITMTSDCGHDLHFIGPVVSYGNNNSNSNISIRAKLIDVKTKRQVNYDEVKSFYYIISSIQQKLKENNRR
ncbi:MAG: hypothetical protein ISP74_01985 [Bacteroidia bacterium]|nr:hypothetical protein [Bacteroidia bacterium]